MAKVTVNDANLLDIGNAIREKNGEQTKYKPREMGAAIRAISSGGVEPPADVLVLSGDCNNWYENPINKWAFDNYKNKMSTKDITKANYMFNGVQSKNIPFDINIKPNTSTIFLGSAFGHSNLTKIPNIFISFQKDYQYRSFSMSGCFNRSKITKMPLTFFTDLNQDLMSINFSVNFDISNLFQSCYFLNTPPKLNLLYQQPSQINLDYIFDGCYNLKEIDLPVIKKCKYNNLDTPVRNTCRMRHTTFDKNREYYKNEILDITDNIYSLNNTGYGGFPPSIEDGIPEEKRIWNDSTYAALKNDPDAWAYNLEYSFYNHDSAVETINSLPNTSGANTIKFEGKSGLKTDGGAINTLTPEEIAVASNKGFTVALE